MSSRSSALRSQQPQLGEEMSPLQKRLLATYMSALDEQEKDYEEEKPTPKPKADEPELPRLLPEQGVVAESRGDTRSNLYAKKMGDVRRQMRFAPA